MAIKSDQKLHDALIRYQLDLRRFEAGTRRGVLAILTKMQKELIAQLANAKITAYNKAMKQALLRQARLIVKDYYAQAQGKLNIAVEGLAKAQVEHAAKILERNIEVSITPSLPTATSVSRIASSSLIEGGTMAAWWSKLSNDAAFKITNAIQQGFAQGESNASIITRLVGKQGSLAGELNITRANAASFVQTAMQTVANDSRLKVFEENADIIVALRWFAAMDGHVCPRCIALNERRWTNNSEHAPLGHTVPFQNPPIHFNDRCVLLPVTKTFAEMGIEGVDEVPDGKRASKYGPIDSKTKFEDYLSRQSEADQNEQLGKGRAQLWRDGKITLAQLIDGNGRELTLAELRAKYD